MRRLRLPLWLKTGWTIWRSSGCRCTGVNSDSKIYFLLRSGKLLNGIGLGMESPLIFSCAASGSLLFQAIYTVDLAAAVLTGHHIDGGTEYMFDPGLPLFILGNDWLTRRWQR